MDMTIDTILESFTLNPFDNIYDPYEYFKEYSEFDIYKYLKEETENTTKRNIFQKLLDLILKGIRFVIRLIGRVIKFFKKLIFGEKQPRTVDQVLADLGIERSAELKDINRPIPWDDTSDPEAIPNHIQLMMKPIKIEFEHDGETITISSLKYLQSYLTNGAKKTPVNDHSGSFVDPRSFNVVMKFITTPELMSELEFIVDTITEGNMNNNTIIRINQVFSDSIMKPNVLPKYKIKLKQFEEFNIRFAKIHDKLKTVDDTRTKINNGNNEAAVKALNKLYISILNIQAGATMLGSCMKNVYVIDPYYCETISDPKILDEFVSRMIHMGLPDKYVAFNSWMASNTAIKGDADVDKPRWGMSRVTYLPPDDKIVYKIAINGWGLRSNNSEKVISNAVYAAGVGERFAKVLDSGPNTAVITMERATMNKERATSSVINEMKKDMVKAIATAGIPGKVGDCKPDNTGFRGDTAISIDYGMIDRVVVPTKVNHSSNDDNQEADAIETDNKS